MLCGEDDRLSGELRAVRKVDKAFSPTRVGTSEVSHQAKKHVGRGLPVSVSDSGLMYSR